MSKSSMSLKINKIWFELWPILLLFFASIFILNSILFLPIKLPWDAYYHFSRVNNLSGNFFQFLYPQNFSTLSQIGIATNIFYPGVSMQIIVNLIPKSITNPIYIYKIFSLLVLFISSLLFYYLLRFKNRNTRFTSFLLAILWGGIIIGFDTTTLGSDALGKLGFPLLCYGLMNIKEKKSYVYISMGTILAFYAHLITAAMVVGFVTLYHIIYAFQKNALKETIKNLFLVGIYTIGATLVVTIPMLLISKSNLIKTPTISTQNFKTWVLSSGNLLSNSMCLIIIIFIVSVISLTKKMTLGQLLSIGIAILGTSFIAWPSFATHTPLFIIQMPIRIFNFGLFMLLCFSIFNLANHKVSKPNYSIFASSILICLTISGFAIHDTNFPTVDQNGNFVVATSKDIDQHYLNNEDGYSINGLGAFNSKSVNSKYIWNLMNYTDYVPSKVLSDKSSSMLSYDLKGKNLSHHMIVTQQGKSIPTKEFTSTSNRIDFKVSQKSNSDYNKLPVLDYNATKIKVYLNNSLITHENMDGQITIHQSLTKDDHLKITQYIPSWEYISFALSLLAWCMLIYQLRHRYMKFKTN